MSPPNHNTDRELLIRIEEQFKNMKEGLQKLGDRFDTFERRMEESRRDFASKESLQRVEKTIQELEEKIEKNYTPFSRFEPVEEIYREFSKRLRTLLVGAALCVIVLTAAIPFAYSFYSKLSEQVQAVGAVKR